MWWGAGDVSEGGIEQGEIKNVIEKGVKQRSGFLVGVYRFVLQLWPFHERARTRDRYALRVTRYMLRVTRHA